MNSISKRPPVFTFVILAFYFLILGQLALNADSLEFPFGLLIAVLWITAPFVIGFLAVRSYKRRGLSPAHKLAYYGCLIFLACLAIALWISK
jgi:hypothetical protein